mmetsp:Transcript_10737/g.12580  ORF Transcript_10737/g.12580 Transcript_10737/m.12580 type:complete len:245 (+) Transcript_10737:1864-2598(+)
MWLIILQNTVCSHEIQFAIALLHDAHAVLFDGRGAMNKRLLHRCRIQDLLALIRRNGTCKKSHSPSNHWRRNTCTAQCTAPTGVAGAEDLLAVCHDIGLDTSVSIRELMGCHTTGAEACDAVTVVDTTDTDDIHLICRVVEGPEVRAVVSDSAHHDDATGSHLIHLLHKWEVKIIRPTNGEIQNIRLHDYGIVEGIQEPRRIRNLLIREHTICIYLRFICKSLAFLRLTSDDSRDEAPMTQAVV